MLDPHAVSQERSLTPIAAHPPAARTCGRSGSASSSPTESLPRRPRRCSAAATASPPADEAETFVALGGDGYMLQTSTTCSTAACPAGVRDEPRHGRLPHERMAPRPARRAHRRRQGDPRHAACKCGRDRPAKRFTHAAINEVSLLRETRQTAKIEIAVNGRVALARTGRRRRARRHPGGVDRL